MLLWCWHIGEKGWIMRNMGGGWIVEVYEAFCISTCDRNEAKDRNRTMGEMLRFWGGPQRRPTQRLIKALLLHIPAPLSSVSLSHSQTSRSLNRISSSVVRVQLSDRSPGCDGFKLRRRLGTESRQCHILIVPWWKESKHGKHARKFWSKLWKWAIQ